jgi:hypothetical protein
MKPSNKMKPSDLEVGAHLLLTAPRSDMQIEITHHIEEMGAYAGKLNTAIKALIYDIDKTSFTLAIKVGGEWFRRIYSFSDFSLKTCKKELSPQLSKALAQQEPERPKQHAPDVTLKRAH